MQRRISGFTMVEMLLVIAIIAVLAAIIFPVIGMAREKSRQSVCASNLRQIGIALALYRADYDDCYPYAVDNAVRYNPENAGSPFRQQWKTMPSLSEALHPYCSTVDIFRCPSDAREFKAFRPDGSRFVAPNRYEAYGLSYGFNQPLGLYSMPDGVIVEPSAMYFASDVGFGYHSYANAPYYDLKGNVLYCDGHVRFRHTVEE